MDLKDLVIGDHYWTVADTRLIMVELISHTGHERPMNCVVKHVKPQISYENYCISWWELFKDPDEALCHAIQGWNDKLQDLEEDIDDLTCKLRRIRETQYALTDLIGAHTKEEPEKQ